MKVTQTASLQQSDSAAIPAQRRAVMGGIVTPQAVAAHARKQMNSVQLQPDAGVTRGQAANRRAAMGGIVTPQAVAAHVRKTGVNCTGR